MRSELLKRGMDIAGAGIGLALTAPLTLAIAAAVRVFLGAPVLFRQERPGLNGAPFEMLKFRTMKDAVDETGKPLPDAARLTRFGRFLRATSLDELPELLNVLRGDMSLVGPRPLLMEYLPRYDEEQRRRHDRKPGITGWAQIHGRNTLTWQQKFEFDVWYVDHWSNGLDLQILGATILAVLSREGIGHEGGPTMPKFMGNPRGPRVNPAQDGR